MKSPDFDVIVVGARCAGSPTAMLLARRGHRVAVLDRATFPSDTLSTHYIWQRGLAQAARWGLLDRIRSTGAPAQTRIRSDAGVSLAGSAPPVDGVVEARSIRRLVLDKLLLDAASEAGAEVMEGFVVTGLKWSEGRVIGVKGRCKVGGEERGLSARLVVGADGMRSAVARRVGSATYREIGSLTFGYYSYWSGTGLTDTLHCQRPGRLVLAWPTNEGLTLVYVGGHRSDFEAFRADVNGSFKSAVGVLPELAGRLEAGRREERYFGTADLPNFYRTSYGPGWALVGDAAYHRDPVTGQGISDAFRDADTLADAVHLGLSGAESIDAALAAVHDVREMSTRYTWEYALAVASLSERPAAVFAYFEAAASNPAEVTRILGVFAGVVPHGEVYSKENIGAWLRRSGASMAS